MNTKVIVLSLRDFKGRKGELLLSVFSHSCIISFFFFTAFFVFVFIFHLLSSHAFMFRGKVKRNGFHMVLQLGNVH